MKKIICLIALVVVVSAVTAIITNMLTETIGKDTVWSCIKRAMTESREARLAARLADTSNEAEDDDYFEEMAEEREEQESEFLRVKRLCLEDPKEELCALFDMDRAETRARKICAQHPEEEICRLFLEGSGSSISDPSAFDVIICFSKPWQGTDWIRYEHDYSHLYCPRPFLFDDGGKLMGEFRVIKVDDPESDQMARDTISRIYGAYLGFRKALLTQKPGNDSPEMKEDWEVLEEFDKEVMALVPQERLNKKIVDETAAIAIGLFNMALDMAHNYDTQERARLQKECEAFKKVGKALPRRCYLGTS